MQYVQRRRYPDSERRIQNEALAAIAKLSQSLQENLFGTLIRRSNGQTAIFYKL